MAVVLAYTRYNKTKRRIALVMATEMTQKKVKRLKGPCCNSGINKGKLQGNFCLESVHNDSVCFTKMLSKFGIRMRRFIEAARIMVCVDNDSMKIFSSGV
jgi:hypothetical protein